MRLTLRTLLAYLDDILDPQDTEDIARKIEESEFANELVHRTRDSMRRLRLGVPPVEGKGLATDANTVAEYLDNTLSAERVGEFEKICLESDVYLAEVASCHQILTLVLGEPAEIDPASRGRMYELASQINAPPVQIDSMQPASAADVVEPASAVTPPTPPRRSKPEVPDYLRESRTRLWPVAAAAVVGALITLGLLVMFGPAEWGQQLVGIKSDGQQAPAAATADGEQADGQPDDRSSDQMPAGNDPLGSPPEVRLPDEAPAEPAPDAVSRPETTELERPRERSTDDPREMPDDNRPAPKADAGDEPAGSDPAPVDSAPVPPEDPSPPEPMPNDPTAAAGDEGNDAAAVAGDGGQDTAFGRYTSKRGEVLLRFDRESGDWKRLPPMAPLAKGDRLLSLPFYRPTIALSTSISIQPDGAAALELAGWTPSGVPIINVEHGRLIMMTVGSADNSIQLNFGQQQAELTFVDAESTIAIEARRLLIAGQDPSAAPANEAVDLYATSGSVRVRLEDKPPLDIQAPARRALIGDGIAPPGGVPSWVTSESLSDSNVSAASDVEELLPTEQFVGLILKELSVDRRSEVRSLAIRSATYLNDFEPCIDALNEKYERNFWPAYIAELRAAIARSPETAGRVRNTFDKQGLVGEALFRMLWGYSADDLRNGAAAELVEGLSQNELNYRVMAIWNLRDITGLPNHGYRPQDLTRQRSQAVNRWKEQLRQGKIVPQAAAGAARPSVSGGDAKAGP